MASSNHGIDMDRSAQHCSSTMHRECTSPLVGENATWFRRSLAREVLREIRNLVWRIREIQRKALDRQGFEVPQLQGQISSPAKENALICCTKDMRNLYASRPWTTLIEAELCAQAWNRGAMWAVRNLNTGLPELEHPCSNSIRDVKG